MKTTINKNTYTPHPHHKHTTTHTQTHTFTRTHTQICAHKVCYLEITINRNSWSQDDKFRKP